MEKEKKKVEKETEELTTEATEESKSEVKADTPKEKIRSDRNLVNQKAGKSFNGAKDKLPVYLL